MAAGDHSPFPDDRLRPDQPSAEQGPIRGLSGAGQDMFPDDYPSAEPGPGRSLVGGDHNPFPDDPGRACHPAAEQGPIRDPEPIGAAQRLQLGRDRTRLYPQHMEEGGRMGSVFGFELPLEYSAGREAEYWTVRRGAGLADADFMRRLMIRGPAAQGFLQFVSASDMSNLPVGQISYTALCDREGQLLDTVTVLRSGADEYLLTADAARVPDHLIQAVYGFKADVVDVSEEAVMLTLQGPGSASILSKALAVDLNRLRLRESQPFRLRGHPLRITRFGFTGQAGFELLLAPPLVEALWARLLAEGARPCGYLAAEDLRIEAGFISMDKERGNPFENRLGHLIAWEKDHFLGREALIEIMEVGLEKILVWLSLDIGGGAAAWLPRRPDSTALRTRRPTASEAAERTVRSGASIISGDRTIGQVSSVGFSWAGRLGLALGYVWPEFALDDGRYIINNRQGRQPARLSTRRPRISSASGRPASRK